MAGFGISMPAVGLRRANYPRVGLDCSSILPLLVLYCSSIVQAI